MAMIPFTPENVARVKDKPGNYYLYGRGGKLLYVGNSSDLRHRLQSYYQKDDFEEHPTKRKLRPKIWYFSVKYRPITKARAVEMRMKYQAPFNKQRAGRFKR